MELQDTRIGDVMTVELKGRLDAMTSPAIEDAILKKLTEIKTVVLDLKLLEYISSTGLRTILTIQKECHSQGISMKIVNLQDDLREIFEMTGFSSIMTIE